MWARWWTYQWLLLELYTGIAAVWWRIVSLSSQILGIGLQPQKQIRTNQWKTNTFVGVQGGTVCSSTWWMFKKICLRTLVVRQLEAELFLTSAAVIVRFCFLLFSHTLHAVLRVEGPIWARLWQMRCLCLLGLFCYCCHYWLYLVEVGQSTNNWSWHCGVSTDIRWSARLGWLIGFLLLFCKIGLSLVLPFARRRR